MIMAVTFLMLNLSNLCDALQLTVLSSAVNGFKYLQCRIQSAECKLSNALDDNCNFIQVVLFGKL